MLKLPHEWKCERKANIRSISWSFIIGFICCWVLVCIFSVKDTHASITPSENDMILRRGVSAMESIADSLKKIERKMK